MFGAPVRAMPFDGHTLATQPSAVLQPPRPPGRPPTLTAVGLAPEMPEPDNNSSRQTSSALSSTARTAKWVSARTTTPLDKVLVVAAAGAGLAAAISVWGKGVLTLGRG